MLTRRVLVSGFPSLLLPIGADHQHPYLAELRRLRPLALAALCREGDLGDLAHYKGGPVAKADYAAAKRYREAIDIQFGALTQHVWSQPARSWSDIVAHAEIALHWALITPAGTLDDLTAECPGERSSARLLKAVADLGGCDIGVPDHAATAEAGGTLARL